VRRRRAVRREYRQRLDAACEALASEVAQLPQTVRDEHLDTRAAAEIAQRAGDRYEDAVTALRRWTLRLASLYEELGADGCADGQRRRSRGRCDGALVRVARAFPDGGH
jgi:hypothetical protein